MEDNCIEFFKNKLKYIFEVNEDILSEIRKSKFSSNYNKTCYKTMLEN